MFGKAFSHFTDSFRGIPRTIWALSFVSLINRFGSMIIAFMTLYLTDALHFDIRSAGYVTVFYGAGCIVGMYLGGWLTDRFGFYRIQIWSLVATGATLLSIMFVHDFWTICAAMFTLGLAAESFRPANQVAIRQNSDDATRTRAFSLMRVAVNFALTFTLAVGGWLATQGWHWLFWVDSLTCFAAVPILILFVGNPKSNTPQYHRFRDFRISQKHIKSMKSNNPNISDTPQYKSDFLEKSDKKQAKSLDMASNSAYRDRDFLLFTVLTLIGATVFMQIMWTIPVFFHQVYGWSKTQIGLFCSINGFFVILVELPLIFKIEGKRPALWFVKMGVAMYGVGHLALLLPVSAAVFIGIFYMIAASMGEILAMPFSSSWASRRAGEARQGQYMALYGMAYSLTNIASPMLGTQIIGAFGFSALWLTLGALSAVAVVGYWVLEKRTVNAQRSMPN